MPCPLRISIVSSELVGVWPLTASTKPLPESTCKVVKSFQLPLVLLRYFGIELTTICAEAVLPVPPFVEVTLPVVFVFVPVVVPVTVISEVQVEFADTVALLNEMTFEATLNVPPH